MEAVESDLSGSRINFVSNSSGVAILDAVNDYYNNQKITARNIKINKDNDTDPEDSFIPLSRDRDKCHEKNPDVKFQFDYQSENNDAMYIQAYRFIGGKQYSYSLFQVKKTGKNFIVTGILDPLI
jgi:hypothetical protein